MHVPLQGGFGRTRRGLSPWSAALILALVVLLPFSVGAQFLPGVPVSFTFTNLVVNELGEVLSAQPGPERPPKRSALSLVPVVLKGHIARGLGLGLTLRWVGGTALPGRDIVLRSSFPAEQDPASATLKLAELSDSPVQGFIRVLDNGLPDPERVARFQLEGPPGALLGPATNLSLTLVDAPGLVVAEARVLETEADSGRLIEGRKSEMEFLIHRHGATHLPVTVDYQIATNRLASAKGRVPEEPGRITLAAGQRTASIRVSIANDDLVDPGPVAIRLTGVSGEARLPAPEEVEFASAEASVPVLDDEDPPNLDAAFSARTLDGPLEDLVEVPGGGWIGVLPWSIRDPVGNALELVRIRPDGSQDPSYRGRIVRSGPLAYSPISGLAAFADGRVVVAWLEQPRRGDDPVCRLMALGPDGLPDPGFRPPLEFAGRRPGNFLALPDGGVLCQTSDGVARLGRDGAVTELPWVGLYSAGVVAPGGGVVLMVDVPVRLRPDLTLDPTFAVNLGEQSGLGGGFHPSALAVDPDQRIWASFVSPNRGSMGRLLRLLPDGRLDSEMTPLPLRTYALRASGRGVVVLGDVQQWPGDTGQVLMGLGEDGRETFREWVAPRWGGPRLVGADAGRVVLFQPRVLDNGPGRFASIRIDGPASTQVRLFPSSRGIPEVRGPGRVQTAARIARYETEDAAYVAIRRAGPTTKPATVHWKTVDGTARSGEDFVGVVDGRTDFLPLEVERRVRIPLLADSIPEGPEYFEVAVTGVEGIEETGPNLRFWIGERVLSATRLADDAGPVLFLHLIQPFGFGGWTDPSMDGWPRHEDPEPTLRFEASQDLRVWTEAVLEWFVGVDWGRNTEVRIRFPTPGGDPSRPASAGYVRMRLDFEDP